MPVLVEKVAGADYKFTVNDNTLTQATVDCVGSSGMTYLDNIGPILLLLDGANLKMCVAALPTISSAASLTVSLKAFTYAGSNVAPTDTSFTDAYYYDPVNDKASILFGNSISTQLYEVASGGAAENSNIFYNI